MMARLYVDDTPLLKRKLLQRQLSVAEFRIAELQARVVELENDLAFKTRQLEERTYLLQELRLLFGETRRGKVTLRTPETYYTPMPIRKGRL